MNRRLKRQTTPVSFREGANLCPPRKQTLVYSRATVGFERANIAARVTHGISILPGANAIRLEIVALPDPLKAEYPR